MREYITKFLPFEEFITKKHNNSIEICGYGNVFCARDYHGDVIQRGAFAKSLDAHRKKNTMPAMLFEHKNRVCGKWIQAQEDNYGLKLEGVIESLENGDIVKKVMNGTINGLSIGFFLVKSHRLNSVRYIKEAHLVEISLVGSPANGFSRFFPTSHEIDYGNGQVA